MRQNVSVHCIDATDIITYLLDPTWYLKKIGRCANTNKSYDAIVIPRKDYFTFPSLWMPLQAGEIWDNTPKQCLGMEHNGGFADAIVTVTWGHNVTTSDADDWPSYNVATDCMSPFSNSFTHIHLLEY